MSYELSEQADHIILRTNEYTLGWSTDSGALIHLQRHDSLNVLGHGPPIAGVDVALGGPANWITSRTFARYLWHRVSVNDDRLVMTIIVGLGPLKIFDHYQIGCETIKRWIEIENVSGDDLRLYGVRLVVPHARVGEPNHCLFEAPGNSVRPRAPLAIAATQDRTILPRRFFAPGLRGGSAFEPAPTQGAGVMALWNDELPLTLLCWYAGDDEAALPYVQGGHEAVSLAYEVAVASWLRSDQRSAVGPQHIALVAQPWPAALAVYRARISLPQPPAAWLRDAILYITDLRQHGGAAGLAEQLPELKALGIDTLCILPWHTVGERPHLIGDLERIDPACGDNAAICQLIEMAHHHGMRVLLDIAMQGCAPDSRYLSEHPEWFVRDDTGAFVINVPTDAPAAARHPGVSLPANGYHFDWTRTDWRLYWQQWVIAQIDRFALDGLRIIAPYQAAPAWIRRPPLRASSGTALMVQALREIIAVRPYLSLLCTLSGPHSAHFAGGWFDYPSHHMLIHLSMRRITPAEWCAYQTDYAELYPAAYRIGFLEMHDTADCNPLADGLRGSRLVQALWTVMLFSGLTPAIWNGQEHADHTVLPRLLALWRHEPVLRHGTVTYQALATAPVEVLTIRRTLGERILTGVVNFNALPSHVLITEPLGNDLLGIFPCSRERRGVGEVVQLAPFGVYCFEG
ncbi:alpha-amylase family glycosyl hydrolase [Chloroflexus sp.]|uniref:alpha-amylase family glycosyl hydrolase n=1 Tax=Chloroflexus sp. TaxID=1904827 RepID=UPI002ACD4F60|nr:alpha-amylase family glycosyl hydrolase [Chloroflexus sp.]